MPRPRKPYLHRYHTRHGKFYWYVRKPGGRRIRLRADFGTPDFDAQYEAAINGQPIARGKSRSGHGTLRWLWEQYRGTGLWTVHKASTRRQREIIMDKVLAASGHQLADAIKPGDIVSGRDRRASKPSQAKGFLVCMRAMFRWAVQAGHVKTDPTFGIKNLPKARGEGFPVWTEDDVALYHARWPLGTKERVWIDVLLYTGLRRGDAVTLGRQHVKDGVATLRTEKGQGDVIVSLPILPVLARTLAAGPTADLAFICGANGKPLVKESFGNFFREACDKAGVKGKSAHGVRKIAATTCADNGATVTELEAIFGWQGGGMAALYTRAADRKRASARAMAMMERPGVRDAMCQPPGQSCQPKK
jgi:site-specific recombinase XerD